EDGYDEDEDVMMAGEYIEDIFQYMRDRETNLGRMLYAEDQPDDRWSRRRALMDWLTCAHGSLKLLPETLYLAVNYLDRYLSKNRDMRDEELGCVGMTALFIAAKYEEEYVIPLEDLMKLSSDPPEESQVLSQEELMLRSLDYDLGWPCPVSFLRRNSKADDYDREVRNLAKYLLEVTIMEKRFVRCVSSFRAAGAYCLARLLLERGDWTPLHVYYSGYTMIQLDQMVLMILECCRNPREHHPSIYKKYQKKKYKKAARLVRRKI
ncbi:hypothetical protein BS50DRAFT_447435, partial [Corynespora cassiicola Philippines]